MPHQDIPADPAAATNVGRAAAAGTAGRTASVAIHAPGRTRRWSIPVAGACVIAAILVGGRFRTPESNAPPPSAISVAAVPVRDGEVPVYLTGLGTVTPLATVTVRTRVDGQLMTVAYREGQVVKTGDPLAEIDPRPFQVQLTQAEGQMARDQALLDNAHLDLARYRLLMKQDAIPKQQLDTQESLVRQYEGAVELDRGQIDSAKLQLDYCRITAPVAGRVGLRLVDAGNIVHATDTAGLVVITQLQPITVVFTIPEDNVASVVTKLNAGARLTVEAWDREQVRRIATGSLETIDNQIDPTTGTLRLKATFANDDGALFPSQFVNARLLLQTERGALVPTAAVQHGANGTFVYVVGDRRTVAMRPVRTGVAEQDETLIDSGVAAGELVVVEGAERLRTGAAVELQAPPESAPAATGAAGGGETSGGPAADGATTASATSAGRAATPAAPLEAAQ